MTDVTYLFQTSCWRYVTFGDLMDVMSEEQVRERGWLNKHTPTVMAKLVWSMEACRMMHPLAHTSNHLTVTGVTCAFQPSCWRYVTLGEVIEDMSEEQVQERRWLNKPESTVMAKKSGPWRPAE